MSKQFKYDSPLTYLNDCVDSLMIMSDHLMVRLSGRYVNTLQVRGKKIMKTIIKVHKIRLNPTPEQCEYFARACGVARFTFNWGLAQWNEQYKAGQKVSALDLKKQFNAIRKEQYPWSYEVTKCAVEGAFMDLGAAFNNFFDGIKKGRKVGYPQFKSKKKSKRSFYLANDKFTVGKRWINVPKLGRVNMAESLRFQGKIMSARISKTASWWFVSIVIEMSVPEQANANPNPPVGIDVGINRLATLSDGKWFENQKPLKHALRKLRRLNRELARRAKGGQNWHKTKQKLARLYYHISCIRDDTLHKMTTEIAQNYGFIGVEHLNVKGMVKNHCLAQSLSDAAFGKLYTFLEAKVSCANGQVVKVDRFFPSSQLCHCCGWRKTDLNLSDRVFTCQECGYQGDRDENASINILKEAARLAGVA